MLLFSFYLVECIQSFATSFLCINVFFYTERHLHWGLLGNFLLSAGQGFVYIFGALLARVLTGRFGRRPVLIAVNLLLALITLPAMRWPITPVIAPILVLYMFVCAMSWPPIESLVAGRGDPHTMSRRVGIYNLSWSFMGAISMAVSGSVIQHRPMGVFMIPCVGHLLVVAALLMFLGRDEDSSSGAAEEAAHVPEAEPALASQHRLALWLSRIALPATYVLIYGMMSMMPSLPVVKRLPLATATLLSSAWLATRWVTFVLLSITVWWHGRPMLLLGCAYLMLIAFLGIVLPGSDVLRSNHAAIAVMIVFQALLGIALGTIYSGSLYFGMVLSEGSTEHGGYHEALIGLGQMLGPGTGAVTQWLWPGHIYAGQGAVAAVILVTVLAATYAARRAKRGANAPFGA